MDLTPLKSNAEVLAKEMRWLALVIDTRMKLYFSQDSEYTDIYTIPLPELVAEDSVYSNIVDYYHMSFDERIILALALAPHIQPHLLDIFFIKNSTYDRGFTEIGGIKGQNHGGFIPTGETAAFIIAGINLEKRLNLISLFSEDHFFRKFKILMILFNK